MSKLTKEQTAQIQQYLQTLPEEEREEKLKEIMSQFEQEPQCPFCLMSEGKIKTTNVYEDSNFLAVLEINPANNGHILLFPKRHIKSSSELTDQEAESVFKIIKKLTTPLSKLNEGLNVLISEGPTSGQRFEHLVINLIPRSKEDSIKISWQPKKIEESELEKMKESLISNIPQDPPKEKPVVIDEDHLKKEFLKHKKRLP